MAETSAAPDLDLVMQMNRRFYRAMADLDLEEMVNVWLHEDWVRCVHPGWAPLDGWDAVHESWLRIFENTESLHVTIGRIFTHIEGDMAWVFCVERVSTAGEGRIDLAYVQATNLFVRRSGEWRMVLHHASSLPIEEASPGEETVH